MSDEKKTIKFQMLLAPSEAEMLDDWGFRRRIRSRAEAIRRLCQIGMMTTAAVPDLAKAMTQAAEFSLKIKGGKTNLSSDEILSLIESLDEIFKLHVAIISATGHPMDKNSDLDAAIKLFNNFRQGKLSFE